MVKRDENGQWQKGASGNPEGTNGHIKGLQRYGSRAAYWLQELSLGELEALCADKKRMKKLPSWDAVILRHIQATLSGGGTAAEREALLNRIEGKPYHMAEIDKKEAKPTHVIVSWKRDPEPAPAD